MEKSEEEKRRDEKISDKFFICLNCFYQVPKIDFIYENNKKKLLYFCSCGEQYSNSLSSYITSLSKLKLNYSINAKCFSTLHPEANSSFYCFQCEKAFCIECQKYHNEFNSHYVIESEKPKIINMCFTHNKLNAYYCSECNQSCCEICKDKHVKHSLTSVYKERGIFSKGEFWQKDNNFKQIYEYIKYVENVYHTAIGKIKNLFSEQPGNYFEDAMKRIYDEERFIKLMYKNIEQYPDNVVSYINLNTIEKIFPLHIIKDEINKFLYCSFFKQATLLYTPHVERRIKKVLDYFKEKKISIGVLLCNDGVYYGEVNDDQKNGQGLISLMEEEVYEGKWEDNILIEKIKIKVVDKKKIKKGKKRKDSVSDASSFREEKIKRENNIFKEGVRGRAGRHFGGREDIESVSRSGSGSRSRSRSESGSKALSGDRAESGSRASSGSGSKSRSKSRSSQGNGSEESSEKFSTPQSFHDEDENSI